MKSSILVLLEMYKLRLGARPLELEPSPSPDTHLLSNITQQVTNLFNNTFQQVIEAMSSFPSNRGRSRSRQPEPRVFQWVYDSRGPSFHDDPFFTNPPNPQHTTFFRAQAEFEIRFGSRPRSPSPPRTSRRSRSSTRHFAAPPPPPPPPPPRSPSPPPLPRSSRRSRSSTRYAAPPPPPPPPPPPSPRAPSPLRTSRRSRSRTASRSQPQPPPFQFQYQSPPNPPRPPPQPQPQPQPRPEPRSRDYYPPRNSQQQPSSGRRSRSSDPMPSHRYVQYEIEELPDDFRTWVFSDQKPLFKYNRTDHA
ncbi:hypothetical protein VTJ04DRAFT_2228 [Mycothermus thermophilus]|uniref:uncharacterized protein n=1 Tax=Humicola insolens TaxID=85995 RepID=UPI003744426D